MAPRAFAAALFAIASAAAAAEAPACAGRSALLGCEAEEEEESALLQRAALKGAVSGAVLEPVGPDDALPGSPAALCPEDVAATPMPAFSIDLDADPRPRWDAVAAAMKDAFAKTKPTLDGTLESFVSSARAGNVDLTALLNASLSQAESLFGNEYYEEMQGLADALEQPFETIVGFTLVYSLSGGCTSIVGNNVEEDTVVHGRLLDYGMSVQPIQIHATFTRGGETAFECATYVGFVGCATGMVPGGFSISLNQKDTVLADKIHPDNASAALENFFRATEGATEPMLFVRNVLTTETSWGQSMLTKVAGTFLTRACYLTVAGVGKDEGVSFSRTADGVDQSRWMNASLASAMVPDLDLNVNPDFDGKPFVFITNENDDENSYLDPDGLSAQAGDDKRGACAWEKLNQYDSFNTSSMWDVLLNPCQMQASTILAAVMVPKESTCQAFSMCGVSN